MAKVLACRANDCGFESRHSRDRSNLMLSTDMEYSQMVRRRFLISLCIGSIPIIPKTSLAQLVEP